MTSINENLENIKSSNIITKSSSKNNLKRPSRKSPKCSQNAYYYFQSFSDNASIDGLKFVGEDGRSILERIFWIIIIIIALLLSAILVYQTFVKWTNSPVLVTFDTTQKPIYEVPFPAVTICPEFKSNRDIFNYTEAYLKISNQGGLTKNESFGYNVLSLVCNPDEDSIYEDVYFVYEDTLNFLQKVAPNLKDIMFDIQWRGNTLNISEIFDPVLTAEGVCWTFNALDKSEIFTNEVQFPSGYFSLNTDKPESQWTTETGYKPAADIDAYPRRTFLAGTNGGLKISLKGRVSNLDYACGQSLQGFKIALHHPAEVSRIDQNHFSVPINQAVVVAVKPNILTTAEELYSYTPEDRQCYFKHEKKLKFFEIYTQRHCLVECETNYTLNSCGCVEFYMPRDNSTRICGISMRSCTDKAKALFLTGDTKRGIKKYNDQLSYSLRTLLVPKLLDAVEVDFNDRCECLPSCYSIDFNIETSQSDWNWKEALKIPRESNYWNEQYQQHFEIDDLYLSNVIIYFKDMQFVTSERIELYGYTDFWANIGGIIGLFTGFSFITIFEILYYLSLRLICNIKMFGIRYWFGSPKVLKNVLHVQEV